MSKNSETLLQLMGAVGTKLIAAEETLTELDSAIGDGDCGASIKKGTQTILDKFPSWDGASVGKILKQSGMALSSSMGGVSGALYATAFLRAGKILDEKEELSLCEIHEALEAALEGIKERGEGTKVGDKTLVDALEPAVHTFGTAAESGCELSEVLAQALEAARKGSDSTIPLIAKKGRASYLGERSVGHRDAGTMVICLVFEAAHDFITGKENWPSEKDSEQS